LLAFSSLLGFALSGIMPRLARIARIDGIRTEE
jgi:hypothetical protein